MLRVFSARDAALMNFTAKFAATANKRNRPPLPSHAIFFLQVHQHRKHEINAASEKS